MTPGSWDREAVIRAGMLGYQNGRDRADNPYRHTPISRQGSAKRAYWTKGWDEAESLDGAARYTITEKGAAMLEGAKNG